MDTSTYDKKIFANNLKHYLAVNDKKAVDICEYLGVSKSTVSSWINADKIPRMDKVERLSIWLGIQKSDLIEEKPWDAPEISPAKQMLLDATKDLSDEQVLKLLNIIEEAKKLF